MSKKTISGAEKLGYKQSSFFDNIEIYGMPIDVAGGIYIEHSYCVIECDSYFAIKKTDGKNILYKTKEKGKATWFHTEQEAQQFSDIINERFNLKSKTSPEPIVYKNY